MKEEGDGGMSTGNTAKEGPRADNTAKSILKIDINDFAKIVAFTGGKDVLSQLRRFGLSEGQVIQLLSRGPFNGPLLIRETKSDVKIMISKTLAKSVMIDKVSHGVQ